MQGNYFYFYFFELLFWKTKISDKMHDLMKLNKGQLIHIYPFPNRYDKKNRNFIMWANQIKYLAGNLR